MSNSWKWEMAYYDKWLKLTNVCNVMCLAGVTTTLVASGSHQDQGKKDQGGWWQGGHVGGGSWPLQLILN